MIILEVTETITLTVSAGTATVDAAFADRDGVTFEEGGQRTSVTGGPIAVVSAPSSGVRMVKSLAVRAGSAATITVIAGGQTYRTVDMSAGQSMDVLDLAAPAALYQPLDADLSALAGLTTVANTLAYFTGSATAALTSLTAYGRSLIGSADETAAKALLSLGLLASSVSGETATLTGSLTAPRSYTLPDASMTFAGQNIDNAFSVAQTFAGSVPGTPSAGQVAIGGGAIKAGGAVTCASLIATGLTPGRVPFVTTGGLLTDAANLNFATSTGVLTLGSNAQAFQSRIDINAAAAQNRGLLWQSGGVSRWFMFLDTGAESGSNAGAQFNLRAYTDAGATLDTPLSIVRAAGGAITLARPVTCTGAVTVPNGTAAAPGIRLTGEAHGLYRVDATTLGFAVAGTSEATLTTAGLLTVTGNLSATGGAIILGGKATFNVYGGNTAAVGGIAASGWENLEFYTNTSGAVSTLRGSFNNSGTLTLTATTDASAIGTAALVGLGGASIAKSIWCAGSAGQYINIANATGALKINNIQVLGAQGAAVADASGGVVIDAEARTAINTLLARMRTHGSIAT